MRISSKLVLVAMLGVSALPAMAQQTGPEGLAEPRVRRPKDVPAPPPPTPATVPANIVNFQLSSGGTVSVLLRPDKAPNSVDRIKTLVNRHFYDGLKFHRVVEGFMAQGGDPKGDGSGGSDLPDLKAEFTELPHVRGAIAMARAQSNDSANSQFYIVTSPALALDGRYTVIGRVISGMTYVDQLEKGEPPPNPSRIVTAYIGAPPANPASPALPYALPNMPSQPPK